MPNNKVKTHKALQGKKGGANLHPHSRRAKQLERVALRSNKLQHQHKHTKARQESTMERHLHFIETMPLAASTLTLDEMHALVREYIGRNAEDLAVLEAERMSRSWRKTESKSKKETEIDMLRERDEAEYRTGFVLPDLTEEENVRTCREWARLGTFQDLPGRKADPGFVSRIRLVAIYSDDTARMSIEHEGSKPVSQGKGVHEGDINMQNLHD